MKHERNILLNCAILVIALCMTGVGWSAPMGTTFTYEGVLTDANSPADGLYDFEFTVYDALEGGTQQGSTVSKGDVDVIDGHFTEKLDFGDTVFTGDARWLEIAVRPGASSDPCDFVTLSPRQEMTPTPYALHSQSSDSDGDWQISGNDMYSTPSGNVGIGDATPSYKLDVDGLINVDTTGGDKALLIDGDEALWYNGSLFSWGYGGTTNYFADDVGIGTNTPQNKLDVEGAVAIGATYSGTNVGPTNGMIVEGDVGIGDYTPAGALEVNPDRLAANGDEFVVSNSGNVGIGTILPEERLTVNGAILRKGSTMRGANSNTHINLGTSSTTGSIGYDYSYSTVGGGYNNIASGDKSTVGGGQSNISSSLYTTVGGGYSNEAGYLHATVAGGYDNDAGGQNAFIGGGTGNIASSSADTVAGGSGNEASGGYSFIGGGGSNEANAWMATVGGGTNNIAGYAATVPGGDHNTASGNHSFAAGKQAKANHAGTFVWADNTGTDFASTDVKQFLLRASNGVGIGTASPEGALDVVSTTGAFIVPRMSSPQRNALTAVNGMIIYNTTTNSFNFYENGAWVTK